jgi:hypothetical protein
VRAWLEGDWSVVEGAFFDGWSGRNIVRPFRVPREWARFRSFDWGSAKPFSVGWWAVAGEAFEAESAAGPVRIGRGTLVRYAEWYGARGPDKGLKLTAEQVAEGIASREAAMAEGGDPRVFAGVADPSIFREDGGPSIAERMARAGVSWRPADNSRVARGGGGSGGGGGAPLGGWDQMRARIAGDEEGPALVVFDTCRDFIRTVPALQHDPARPEDVDTRSEDHAADECRYACMSRPMARRVDEAAVRRVRDYERWRGGRGGAGYVL